MRKNEGHKISKAPIAVAGMLALATSCARHSANEPRLSYRTHGVSQGLYAQRVRDQVNLESLEREANALRFRFSSGIMRQRWGTDDTQRRQAYAVPLGIEAGPNGPALAVLTTRCVIDYRYPLERELPKWSNLAIFSETTKERPDVGRQVFALSNRELPGTGAKYDPKRDGWIHTDREYLSGPLGNRYFDVLMRNRAPKATATLPVGTWSSNAGVDLAVLHLPLRDSGVQSLVPGRNLEIANSLQAIRSAMDGRLNLWGDTFQFSLVSRDCMNIARDEFRRAEREAKLWRGLAIVSAVSFALPLLSSGAALEGLTGMLVSSVRNAARDTVWSTLKGLLSGQQIQNVSWESFGRLVLHHASNDPRLGQLVLAGVQRTGLTDEQAADIVADVRQALASQDSNVSVMTRPTGSPTASVFLKNRGIELAADLLRTGRVRLDLNDMASLAQQLGLLQAARAALSDPSTSTPLVADVAYRTALTRVAEQLGAP